ncbi:MAG: dihydrofolate reductase [Rhodothermales bacterium]|jgi:dihydrofolate reductase
MSTTSGRVRVYLACSLDGFIAGVDDNLLWLPGAEPDTPHESDAPDPPPDADSGDLPDDCVVTYDDFMADVGALLMGRRTLDVVLGFGVRWPYGETPVLVATHRRFAPPVDSVRAVQGDIADLVGLALEAAEGKDVYLDGGNLIRQALDAGLVDEMIVAIAPVLLGDGLPLFAGLANRQDFEFVWVGRLGMGMVQYCVRPRK